VSISRCITNHMTGFTVHAKNRLWVSPVEMTKRDMRDERFHVTYPTYELPTGDRNVARMIYLDSTLS
jgi:hypothetical protein